MTDSPLRLPGQERPTGNPLLVLSEKLDGVIAQLKRLGDGSVKRHEYGLWPANPDDPKCRDWITYCIGCSEAQERFVWPCSQDSPVIKPTPPSAFTAPEAEDSTES